MKVKRLIKLLEKQNPNHHIVVASDSEGNSFGLLDDDAPIGNDYWDYGANELAGFDEGEKPPKGCRPVVILWPN